MTAIDRLLQHPRFGPPGVNERMAQLCQGLNMIPSIKIVGSNGKGTTAHLMARMAQGLGKSVGLYTSPHLLHVNERIQINGRMITDEDLDACLTQALMRAAPLPQSGRFEILTLAALIFFAEQNVDLAIMEIGLGGRFDPVRIAPGTISVLTSIDLEHTAILGKTLHAIASEKAAVCKAGDTLLSAVGGLEDCIPDGVTYIDLSCPPLDPLQSNARLAAHALKQHFALDTLPETYGVQVPGRLQKLSTHPPIYVDVAHNAQSVATAVSAFPERPISLICAFKNDKDLTAIKGTFHHVVALQFDVDMHTPDHILTHLNATYKDTAHDIDSAITFAKDKRPEDGVILCLGGFGMAGRVLAYMQGAHYDVIGL
ncbi:bifunctional folylpolyglutamate synthase/dihydrofolate synthase [Terasakiella sp.]|uniref:bifunctional folylpolyglutamate synthase/dihydrofolate synthase n=1 Tax=Terasakiella sp. TaxID=2034861 RepID=UPI003AA7AD22